MQNRRGFVKNGLTVAAGIAATQSTGHLAKAGTDNAGVLHKGIIIGPRPGVQEASLDKTSDGRYWLLFGEGHKLVQKFSEDQGRTWGKTQQVQTVAGGSIALARNNPHLSLVRLKSGRLGMVYGGPVARPGRDGTVLYRTSADNGKTWSEAVPIDALFAVCRTQAARVLNSGRIVVPVMAWLSSFAGGESEAPTNGLVYGWVYYSDDEGQTWKRNLSELFVSIDRGQGGCYHFEEPAVEQLKDGRLLMIGRTEFGRPYQSVSKDEGVSWSQLEPCDLAGGYTPSTLMRIPKTGDLLLVWNQISAEEMVTGLLRHRLSTAISKDEGVHWTHFRNLESMDNRSYIEPPGGRPQVYRMQKIQFHQPTDKTKYPHAPGVQRICYPTVVFTDNEVAIAYDYGFGPGEYKNRSSTKIKIVTLNWLYKAT